MNVHSYFCPNKHNRAKSCFSQPKDNPLLIYYQNQIKEKITEAIDRQKQIEKQIQQISYYRTTTAKFNRSRKKFSKNTTSEKLILSKQNTSVSIKQTVETKNMQISSVSKKISISNLQHQNISLYNLLKKAHVNQKKVKSLMRNPFYKILKTRRKFDLNNKKIGNQMNKTENQDLKEYLKQQEIQDKHNSKQNQLNSTVNPTSFKNFKSAKINRYKTAENNQFEIKSPENQAEPQEIKQSDLLNQKIRAKSQTIKYYEIKNYYELKYGQKQLVDSSDYIF